jgi:Zn-dependent protease with chaperone function
MSNHVECPLCGFENKVSLQALERVKIRCARCKLYLKTLPHAKFRHLDPAVYRHPLEIEAFKKLSLMPGINTVLQKIAPLLEQNYSETFFAANGLRVSPQQYPDLYAKLESACRTLGHLKVPPLYVSFMGLHGDMGLHSYAAGDTSPFIVISPEALEHLEEEEVLALLSHELGHIQMGTLRYRMAADMLGILISKTFRKTPLEVFADSISLPVQQAMLNWRLHANLSADRSAILVLQEPHAVFSLLLKLSGGINSRANLDAFMSHAERFDGDNMLHWIEQYWQQFLFSRQMPSFPVWRAHEINNWSKPSRKGYGFQDIVKVFAVEKAG